MQDLITFEQPLNEHIRICLRLEHLFKQAEVGLNAETVSATRSALWAILETLNVIDRPDLKAKLTSALSQQAQTLATLENRPGVDEKKLQAVLSGLDRLIDSLHNSHGKLGKSLRENPFLNTIRQHLHNPGGACDYATPSYFLWLKQTSDARSMDLKKWFAEFANLREIVDTLLDLTRHSASPKKQIAKQSFFQTSLDSNQNFELIRVNLPADTQYYPEISVGRHRLAIRFNPQNINGDIAPLASKPDIEFSLVCCAS